MDKLKHKRPASNVILIIVGALVAVTIVFIAYWSLRNGNRVITRPQEPKEPFPYESVDITFFNESSDITLSGTLTVPSDNGDKFPAIILISGYGPQDRNAEWNNHKPFLVIADHLTRVGFAVLRYDDRGFGKSTGDYHSSTSLDFSTDVESAVEFLKSRDDIDFQQKISLIGHSDGAMVASILAARSKDIGSIILLGAPGILGSELMIKRQVLIDRKLGRSENEIEKSRLYMKTLVNIIANGKNAESIKNNLQKFANETKSEIPADQLPPGMTTDEFINRQITMFTSPWFKYFFTYDPSETWLKINCPVLVISGDKDVQAPPSLNLPAIKNGLASGGNSDVTIKELKNVNHMFQECRTGMVDEYALLDETFSPLALNEIGQWLKQRIK